MTGETPILRGLPSCAQGDTEGNGMAGWKPAPRGDGPFDCAQDKQECPSYAEVKRRWR